MKAKLELLVLAAGIVVLTACSTVESRVQSHQSDFNTWPPPVQQMVKAGQVGVGFTREQVEVALGSPDYTFMRTATDGTYEVWSYRDRGPRFSFGIGMGSFGRSSAVGGGVGVNNIGYAGEHLRVTFDQTGHVSSIERMTRG
jgi:outer membrane protein assembly factor BamE (lipoprotein component of BamABCDE complex)